MLLQNKFRVMLLTAVLLVSQFGCSGGDEKKTQASQNKEQVSLQTSGQIGAEKGKVYIINFTDTTWKNGVHQGQEGLHAFFTMNDAESQKITNGSKLSFSKSGIRTVVKVEQQKDPKFITIYVDGPLDCESDTRDKVVIY